MRCKQLNLGKDRTYAIYWKYHSIQKWYCDCSKMGDPKHINCQTQHPSFNMGSLTQKPAINYKK